MTADALHCQREHVAYLARRRAHWIPTGLPWRLVPDADRGHGRREIRTLKILSVSTGIDFPGASQAIQIRRRRRRLDEPRRFTTETVYAITDFQAHQAKPMHLTDWIRGHWSIENKTHWVRDVTGHRLRVDAIDRTILIWPATAGATLIGARGDLALAAPCGRCAPSTPGTSSSSSPI